MFVRVFFHLLLQVCISSSGIKKGTIRVMITEVFKNNFEETLVTDKVFFKGTSIDDKKIHIEN